MAETLTHSVMIGHRAAHLSPHLLNELTGSVAADDGEGTRARNVVSAGWYKPDDACDSGSLDDPSNPRVNVMAGGVQYRLVFRLDMDRDGKMLHLGPECVFNSVANVMRFTDRH